MQGVCSTLLLLGRQAPEDIVQNRCTKPYVAMVKKIPRVRNDPLVVACGNGLW